MLGRFYRIVLLVFCFSLWGSFVSACVCGRLAFAEDAPSPSPAETPSDGVDDVDSPPDNQTEPSDTPSEGVSSEPSPSPSDSPDSQGEGSEGSALTVEDLETLLAPALLTADESVSLTPSGGLDAVSAFLAPAAWGFCAGLVAYMLGFGVRWVQRIFFRSAL